MNVPDVYWAAFAATVAIETPVAGLLGRRGSRDVVLLCALLLNLFTHPLAFYCLNEWQIPFVVAEATVCATEALGYRLVARQSWPRALLISLFTNGLTILAALYWF